MSPALFNIDLEAAVLGGILVRPATLGELPTLEPVMFYDAKHRVVFEAMRNVQHRGEPIDIVTLETEIERRGKLEAVGGPSFLGELALRIPTIENAHAYARQVEDYFDRREVRMEVAELSLALSNWPHDPGDMIEEAGGRIARIAERSRTRTRADRDRLAAHAQALADVREKLAPVVPASRPWLFELDAVDLLEQQFDGPRWLVTGLITRGAVAMIGAEPKAAKTWLGTELAVAVATGTLACGEFTAEAGRVAYFYAEDRDVEVKSRVRALITGANRRIASDRLRLQPRGRFLDILRDEDLAWIVASVRRCGRIDLLVLDPLRDLHSGEEDKSDSMRNVMRRLRVLAELLDCTVAVVHHAIKTSKETSKRRPGQNLRGSSAIHGAVDAGLYLSDTGGDEVTTFSNTVSSQVKGARSAGRFKITITITDNDAGEALSATWKVERLESRANVVALKKAAPVVTAAALEKAQDDEKALWFIRRLAKPMSKRALRDHDHAPISEGRMRKSIDRLLDSGRCSIQDGVVVPGPATQLEVVHHA